MPERIQLVGEIPEPRHWPIMPMAQFGTVPNRTEPLFRIVWAPSVLTLVGGEFADGFTGYRARPSYRHVGECWILEKWISAFDLTKMDEATYNATWKDPETGLIRTGPYPRNGIYFFCHKFEGTRPNINIPLLVALIKKAKLNPHAANQKAILDMREAEEKADFQARYDKIKDLQSVGGIRPANIGGRVKRQKSMPALQPAPLPTRGAFKIKPTEQQLAVAGF
jgi:hypothetical protein